jgi:uncharacterized protein YllA (UPF0747 family)
MTPEQLEDILEKADTVHTTKLAYDAKVTANNTAITNAANSRASWLSAIHAGQDETTLTNLLNQYIATEVAEAEALTDLQTAAIPYSQAQTALEQATQAVIDEALTPPPP